MFNSTRTVIKKIQQIEKILGKSSISWKILPSHSRHLLLEIDNKWIFKFFKSQNYIKRKALEEEMIKKIKRISSCQVPNIEFSGIDFFGYPIIKGQSLNVQIWRSMDKNKQSAFAAEVADFLKTLHTFSEPVDGIAEYWPPNQDWLYKEISQKLYPKLSVKAQLNISRYLDEAFADKGIMAGEKTLVHGDIYEANIIMNNNRLSGILDFEEVKVMTPAFDFAKMHISFRNPKIADEILKKYNRSNEKCFMRRMFFMILLRELERGYSSVHKRHWFLYRLEKKYGDMNKAQLHKVLNLMPYFTTHYTYLQHEGFKKCLLNSYNYRKQQVFNWIGKR